MVYEFGGVTVDLDRVEIRHHGETVAVQPQVFSVIEYLLAHRHRVVSKEELLDNIWGDRFVGESTLTSRIKSARRALGDDGSAQAVIKTVHGRGYRFVATLTDSPGSDPAVTTGVIETTSGAAVGETVSHTTSANAHVTDPTWPLVGRHRELTDVERWFDDGVVRAVIVTGPDGVESSRFAETCVRYADRHGVATARVAGIASATDLPLMAIAALLPHEVFDAAGAAPADDLVRTSVIRSATAAVRDTIIERSPDRRRLLLHVDAPELLDSMSATVLRALLDEGSLFAVIAADGRAADRGVDFVDEATTETIQLTPLSETDVDILLHRVLGGPVDPATLQRLMAASSGRPDLLRDIVDTSRSTGALLREDGVWRLVGSPSSRSTRVWQTEALSDDAVRIAQLLAIAGSLPVTTASIMIGSAALDELDRRQLLALDARRDRVSLADPLVALEIESTIGPLQRRRLIADLASTLDDVDAPPDPVVLLAVLARAGDADRSITPELVIEAAQRALIEGDMATAGELLSLGRVGDRTAASVIAGEVALSRAQWSLAETIFEDIDESTLDDMSAAHVIRRRAAIRFYARGHFDEAIEELRVEAARRPGRAARALEARRVGMLAYLGRADDVLDLVEPDSDYRGLTGIELILSHATAWLLRGRMLTALELLDEADGLIDRVPDAWASEPRDGVLIIRALAMLELGDVEGASQLVRSNLPIGRRTPLGYLPSVAAEIELAAGRPRAAREFLRQAIRSSHRDAFPHYARVAEAQFARTDCLLGRTDQAAAGLTAAIDALDVLGGEHRCLVAITVAEIAAGLDRPVPVELLSLADLAGANGATVREAQLLLSAARHDPSGDIARSILDRIEALASGFDGQWWPIRVSEVRALAEGGAALGQVLNDYRSLGLHGETVRVPV